MLVHPISKVFGLTDIENDIVPIKETINVSSIWHLKSSFLDLSSDPFVEVVIILRLTQHYDYVMVPDNNEINFDY